MYRCIPGLLPICAIAVLNGCTEPVDVPQSHGEETRTVDDENASVETRNVPPLALGVQNYIVSADRYDQGDQYDNPDAALVRQLFEDTDWNDPDVRPIFRLVRPVGGRVQLLQVRRNQTEAGEYHVAWAGFTDGQTAEGESTQIDSPDKLLEMLLAFLNDDPELRNLIEWDYLDVQPVD